MEFNQGKAKELGSLSIKMIYVGTEIVPCESNRDKR